VTTALVSAIDKKAFSQCFNVLAKRLRVADVDAADLQSYYTALSHLPEWALEQGATELAIEKGRRFFPTTAEWASAADAAIQRRLRESLSHGRVWQEECVSCHDSGWKEYHCTATSRCGRIWCEKNGERYTHDYYAVCPCRPNNHTYQRQTQSSKLGKGEA
jgi:hypothetical protein